MITIKAFNALRPKVEWAQEVAALPYDVMTTEKARQMVAQHPYSFLNIDKPEIHVGSSSDAPYIHASRLLEQMVQEGIFITEAEKCLYIYEMKSKLSHQYGLACLVSTSDYRESKIKKHEQTRTEREQDRIKHILYCGAHTGPIFLIEDQIDDLGQYLKKYTACHKPLYHFTENQIEYGLYAIREVQIQQELIKAFETVQSLYIADGHHRAAAASKVAEQIGTSRVEANDFLAVIFPKEQLKILPYHRMVKDESGYTKTVLLDKLSSLFKVRNEGVATYIPTKLHEIGMFYQKEWYSLELKPEYLRAKNSIQSLDVSILQEEILSPIFKIKDPRIDKRIDFLPGLSDIDFAKACSNQQKDVVFTLFPTAIDALIQISDEGLLMPPKSTWFEPKLRSGLLIHQF